MQSQALQLKTKFEKYFSNSANNERWLNMLVTFVVVVLLASALAQLTWRIFAPDTINKAGKAIDGQKITSQAEPVSRLRSISSLSLFGKTDVIEKIDAPIVAPETRLQLKLKGVFASSNPERAFAIISDSKNKDKSYRLGSKVAGGATLHAVYADKVILKRNGRLETLRMSTSYDKAPIKTSLRPARRTTARPSRVVKASPKLKRLRETLIKDPQKIWQQVRVNPVLKNGSIKGYTLEHNDKQLMRSLNLQKGDVITAVNGKSLSDPSSLYGLMNQLKSQKSLNVTIERNNQLQTIQLQM